MKLTEVLKETKTISGLITLYDKNLTSIPEKYEDTICLDDFHMRGNRLIDLKGCPKEVGGSFSTKNDNLNSLKGCPVFVGKWFQCKGNRITNLNFCPKEVNGNFYCSDNHITTLVGINKHLNRIKGKFDCSHNPILAGGIGLLLVDGITFIKYESNMSPEFTKAVEIINTYLKKGKKGLLKCQNELEEAGLGKFAKL